jgi:EmrB/QacA subfamily drug resistance transporter
MGMASVNVAIPNLASDLNASAQLVGWLPTLYLLSSVAFMLPCGKLADNYGRKRVYVAGLILHVIAAAMSAWAHSIESVLVWRFIQGAAGAMIFGTGVAIITSVVPVHRRGTALGIVASCVYLGLTIAPAIGGWLTEIWGWRSVFFFQVPLVVVLLVFIKISFKGDWKNQTHSDFDWLGTVQFAAFSAFLVIGLSRLPSLLGLACVIASVLALGLFILHQSRHSQPLIRVQLFRENRLFSLSLTTSFFMYGSNFALIFLMSLYLQYVRGFGPAAAGQILLLQALAMALVAPFAGKLADRFQPRIIATLGCVIVAVGFALLNHIDNATTTVFISASLLLVGVGFGLFSTPNNTAIMGAVDSQEVGVASASMNLSRTIGNLVGMSIVNLMIQHNIGDVALSAKQNSAIMETVSLAFAVSLFFVLIACIISALRGRR